MSVVPYDPAWPQEFEAERATLERVLTPWLDGGIHHVGSTAVVGLAAKPIIDMIAGIRDLEGARGAFQPLAELGYVAHQHRPEAHLFIKAGRHLHLTEPGSDIWRERLAFRDALRSDPALAAEYAAWKAEHTGPDGYDADKRPLVLRVLADVGLELKPDEERLSPDAHRSPS